MLRANCKSTLASIGVMSLLSDSDGIGHVHRIMKAWITSSEISRENTAALAISVTFGASSDKRVGSLSYFREPTAIIDQKSSVDLL